MKHIIKTLALLSVVILSLASCSKQEYDGKTLSFSRSIYILPAMSDLEVELRASEAPAADMEVQFKVSGNAEQDGDYVLSDNKFTIKAGETTAKISITPKNNLEAGREIRLELVPTNGYRLGSKNVAMIPVEIKEKIMYSLRSATNVLLSSVYLVVELKGEMTGTKYQAAEPIHIPFEIVSGGTAVLGEQYTIEDDATEFVIPAGKRVAGLEVKLIDDGSVSGTPDGKSFTVKIGAPTENQEQFYLGNYQTCKTTISQLVFSDLAGKWKPVGLANEDTFTLWDMSQEELAGIPRVHADGDYLEFASDDQNGDRIISHLSTGLTSYFGPEGTEHAIRFDHIEKDFMDLSGDIDIPYFVISDANRLFSSTQWEDGDLFIGLAEIDENNIYVYFHEFTPTDFMVPSYEMMGNYFEAWLFGVTYQFTRVE